MSKQTSIAVGLGAAVGGGYLTGGFTAVVAPAAATPILPFVLGGAALFAAGYAIARKFDKAKEAKASSNKD